jgi:hypothetical protein
MSTNSWVAAIVLAVVVPILVQLGTQYLVEIAPQLAGRIVRAAARILPSDYRERYAAEWMAEIDALAGRHVSILATALRILLRAPSTACSLPGTLEPEWQRFAATAALSVFGLAGFITWMQVELGGRQATVLVGDLIQTLVPLLAGAVCFRTAYRSASTNAGRAWVMPLRRAWWRLGAAALSWGVGQAAWTWLELVEGREVPFPSAADFGYLGAPPLAIAGMLAFLSMPGAVRIDRTRLLLRGLAIACSLLAASWIVVGETLWHQSDGGGMEHVLTIGYPMVDVITVAIAVTVLIHARGPVVAPLVLVAISMTALLIADTAFGYLASTGQYATGALLDAGWVVCWLMLVLAPLHPGSTGQSSFVPARR